MRLLSVCTLTALIVLGITSCRRTKDEQSGSTLVPVFTKGRYAKILIWDSAAPSKAVQVYVFSYDDKERVKEIRYASGDSSNGKLDTAYIRSMKCYYNGDDTKPYKTIGWPAPYFGDYKTEVYHFYNSDGIVVKDSVGAYGNVSGYCLRRFIYRSNNIIISTSTTYATYPYTPQTDLDSLVIENNTIPVIYTDYVPGSQTVSGFKCNYDNKINPTAILNTRCFMILDGIDNILTPGYCKNNITSHGYGSTINGGPFVYQNNTDYIYTYDNIGLPLTCHSTGKWSFDAKFYYVTE